MVDSAGRKDILVTMLRSNTLWEEGCLAECWWLAEDTLVVLGVLLDFAGDKRISSRTLFPRLSAEDNPVISCWGNNSLNKAERRVRALLGDTLPEFTGGNLIAWGDRFRLSWGTGLDSSGEFWTVLVMFFNGTYPDALEDRTIRLLRPTLLPLFLWGRHMWDADNCWGTNLLLVDR